MLSLRLRPKAVKDEVGGGGCVIDMLTVAEGEEGRERGVDEGMHMDDGLRVVWRPNEGRRRPPRQSGVCRRTADLIVVAGVKKGPRYAESRS